MGPRCTRWHTRLGLIRPGLVAYQDALEMQRRLAERVRDGGDEALILLEHRPVYTFGVRGKREHLLTSETILRARGADVVRTDRGGDVTFHGPGQIVGYPILNLRARGIGPATYVRSIEQVIIDALRVFDIDAGRVVGRPGVWATGAKIAAIGVRVSRGVTTHGFALNVNTDLSHFRHIVPCGIADATVTSMEHVLGVSPQMREVEDAIVDAFADVFATEVAEPAIADRSEDLSLQGMHEHDVTTLQPTDKRLPVSTGMERGLGGEVAVGR